MNNEEYETLQTIPAPVGDVVGRAISYAHKALEIAKAQKEQKDTLLATMKQMEDALEAYPMIVRCHRAFMANLAQVEQISSNSRAMQLVMRHNHDTIPVSRSNVKKLKELLG